MATIRTTRNVRARATVAGTDLRRTERIPASAADAPNPDAARATTPSPRAPRPGLGHLPPAELRDLADSGWDA